MGSLTQLLGYTRVEFMFVCNNNTFVELVLI